MAVDFNHTIVWVRDSKVSATFLSEILGLPAPRRWGPFLVVTTANGTNLDFINANRAIAPQHYAFLVSDAEFDAAFAHIRAQGVRYYADPRRAKPSEINHLHGGRGVYFEDPSGHLMEIITHPYGDQPQQV